MKYVRQLLLAGVLGLAAGPLLAQELIIYPAKGQSVEQREKDKFQYHTFAKGQSGFDPMALPTASAPPPANEAPEGGALGGAAIGYLTGDTKQGAKIGAVGGGLLGGMRRHDQKAREDYNRQQWEQQQVQQYSQNRNNYNRAFSACMEGRGYTVR